jgi:VWFA-related protein
MFWTTLLRRTAVAVTGALLLSAAVMAQQQFVLSSQDRARLIAVDFTALGPDGRPTTDLQPEDVTLRIDGRTRAIRSLEYISTTDNAPRVPPPFGTNVLSGDSRAILLVIDDETLRPGGEADLKEDIRTFLARLNPADRVALVNMPYGSLRSDFTTEHSRIMTALQAVVGRAPQGGQGANAGCTTRGTLVSLAGLLDNITSAEAPLTVVLFTGGLVAPRGVESLSRTSIDGVDTFNTMGTCEVLTDHYNHVNAAAARSRTQLYVVLPELSANNAGRAGLEHLAGQTGAPLWNLRSGTETALDRVAVQSSGFYLARIEPDPSEDPNTVRGYSVSSNRPGVTIRHRPQLQARRPASATAAAAGVRAPLDMMREARLFTDLPLRVSAATSRNADGSLKVVALFDAPGTDALSSAMVALFDGTGRMVASSTATSAELTGNPKVAALTAPPGDYRLRVAALDPQNRAGAADLQVTVGLVDAGPLKMSSLVLGQNRPDGFRPRLEFSSEVTALAMLEIYGGAAGTPVGVAFEIATSPNGPAMATLPGAFAPTNEPDKFVVTAAIPVGALKPGDYTIRAIVAVQGQAGGRVVRTLRKLPPPQ